MIDRDAVVSPAVAPTPPLHGVPHGGSITHVAVTVAGDAALSADSSHGVRLWPALDGSREPVPLSAGAEIKQLALVRDGRELVAIVRDAAGAVTLVRCAEDGRAGTRAQLASDEPIVEVAAVDGGVVARTADHALVVYGLDGTARGRLVAGAGERITDLAARGTRIGAIVATSAGTQLRWVTLSPRLAWSAPIALPLAPRDDLFAISPSGRRIAYADVQQSVLHVMDIGFVPTLIAGERLVHTHTAHDAVGFLDEDTVAVTGGSVTWWRTPIANPAPSTDPWNVPTKPVLPHVVLPGDAPAGAFADGLVVSGYEASLALSTKSGVRYLGWATSPSTIFTENPSHVVFSHASSQFSWLTDDLAIAHAVNLRDHQPRLGVTWGQPFGDRYVVVTKPAGDVATLLDAVEPEASKDIKLPAPIERYFFGDGVLGIVAKNTLYRYRIDLTGGTTTATELTPAVKLADNSLSYLQPFDASLADGLVAVTLGWEREWSEQQVLTFHRIVDGKMVRTKQPFSGQIVRSRRDGQVVLLHHHDALTGYVLRVMRGDTLVREIKRDKLEMPLAVNADATRFATREGAAVVMLDEVGSELWRTPVWAASSMLVTGSRVVIAAPGGFVALDIATGETVARACGFDFGLHVAVPEGRAQDMTPVCEDPLVQ